MLFHEILLSSVIYPEDYQHISLFQKDNLSYEKIKTFLEHDFFKEHLISNAMIEFQLDVSKDLEIIDYIPTAHSIEIPDKNPTNDYMIANKNYDYVSNRYNYMSECLSVEYYVKCVVLYSECGKEINFFKLKHPCLYDKLTVGTIE